MKSFALRTFCALGIATLLTACGIGAQADLPTQTAAAVQADVGVPASASTAAAGSAPAATQVASATMPAPDCAADGCKDLRIIDANAEAFRYDAMHRGDGPQS